jgi:signal transduction histidine kinase
VEHQSTCGNYSIIGREMEAVQTKRPQYTREAFTYLVEMGTLQASRLDTASLLKRIAEIYSSALHCCSVSLYLSDGDGLFCAAAIAGSAAAEAPDLSCAQLPVSLVASIIDEYYRISHSYFLPGDAAIWQDEQFSRYFITSAAPFDHSLVETPPVVDRRSPGNLLLVPLMSIDGRLLGFLLPLYSQNSWQPTPEALIFGELFAKQAAAVIESAALSSDLLESVREARASEHAKNNFLMLASHELRTPLTAVQGYLELLGDHWETLETTAKSHFIQNARRSCEELVLLMGNVLDLTHLEAEKISFYASAVDLFRSAQLILSVLEPIIVREKRVIEVNIPENVFVWGDELRLRQILLNLLGNALKYTPAGSCVALTSAYIEAPLVCSQGCSLDTLSGPFVVLTIRDWGPGIAPEKQGLLFTKFGRLESARKSGKQGAGLGLYLCRQLVEAMHGSIWLESSGVPGEGVAFCLALPTYDARI